MSQDHLFRRVFSILKLVIITVLLIIISLENKEYLIIFEKFLKKTIQVNFTVLSDKISEVILHDNHTTLLRL